MLTIDEILDDLWDPAGTPVNLPESDEAITTQVTYTELELQLSAIAEERERPVMKLSLRATVQLMLANSTIAVCAAVIAGSLMGCAGEVSDPEPGPTYAPMVAARLVKTTTETRCGGFTGAWAGMGSHCESGVIADYTCDFSSGMPVTTDGYMCAVEIPAGEKVVICVTLTCISVSSDK